MSLATVLPEFVNVVSRSGTSARGWCNECDFGSNGWVSPREAFDWAYKHVEDKHGANRKPELNLDADIYLPSDLELMVARHAICSYIYSIANGNLEPRQDVMDTIAKAVVVAMRWRPQRAVGAQEQP